MDGRKRILSASYDGGTKIRMAYHDGDDQDAIFEVELTVAAPMNGNEHATIDRLTTYLLGFASTAQKYLADDDETQPENISE